MATSLQTLQTALETLHSWMPLNPDTQISQIFSSPDKRQEYYSPFSKLDSIICYYELNLVMFILNVKIFVQFVEIIDIRILYQILHIRE